MTSKMVIASFPNQTCYNKDNDETEIVSVIASFPNQTCYNKKERLMN